MAKRSKEPLFWALGVIVVVIAGSVAYGILNERARIVEGLRIARVAINEDDLRHVNSLLVADIPKQEILKDHAYQGLVTTLKELNDSFPVKSKWTYIVNTNKDPNFATLSVLTIPVVKDDPTTFPGFAYPVTDYPFLESAIYSEQEIVLSGYVWDKVYSVLVRSGFIKIYDKGEVIGILAVDIDASQILSIFLNTMLYTAIVVAAITLVMMRVTNIFFGVSPREMEIINACLDQEKFEIGKK